MKLARLTDYLLLVALLAAMPVAAVAAQGTTTAGISQPVDMELKDTQIKDAIHTLFKGRGLNYVIDPNVTGRVVELKITGVTFKQALDALCEAAELVCTVTDKIYVISPAAPKGSGPTRNVVQSGAVAVVTTPPPTASAPSAGARTSAEGGTSEDETGKANEAGRPTNVIVSQTASPIYYTPPSYPTSGGYGGFSYNNVPYTRVGNIGFVGGGGWGAPVLVGGPTLFWTRDFMPPPPPGYVNPELQRFLQAEYATRSRQYMVPIY